MKNFWLSVIDFSLFGTLMCISSVFNNVPIFLLSITFAGLAITTQYIDILFLDDL